MAPHVRPIHEWHLWQVRFTSILLGPTARLGGLEADRPLRRAPGVAAADGRAIEGGTVAVGRAADPTRR
jgi:hypothetical protein